MRRFLFIATLAIVSLTLMSCEEDGELRIRNRTNSHIWFSVNQANQQQLEGWTNWSRYYSEDTEVTIDFNGNFVFANSITRNVYKGLVTTIDITADGGAIKVINDSTTTITEVYLSPSDDTSWGENDLVGTITPNGEVLWTVTPGQWDIKLLDNAMGTFYLYDQTVTLDQTTDLLFSSFIGQKAKSKVHGAAPARSSLRVQQKH
jgi:hypothetical protein